KIGQGSMSSGGAEGNALPLVLLFATRGMSAEAQLLRGASAEAMGTGAGLDAMTLTARGAGGGGLAAETATQAELFQTAPQFQQYALRAVDNGFYPVMVHSFDEPQWITYLQKGDVWKFGTTQGLKARYPITYLRSIGEHGVYPTTEFIGTEGQAI